MPGAVWVAFFEEPEEDVQGRFLACGFQPILFCLRQAEVFEPDTITRNMIRDLMDAVRNSGLQVQGEKIVARPDASRFKSMI